MKRKNTRSLDLIADAIHKLDRANIIDKGDLLLEAKAQCEPGQWLNWLETECEYSEDSAERYMKVAKLASRFRNLRNLRLGKTTLYALADHQNEEDLPAIVKELAKYATKKRLTPRDAERVIQIGIGRRRFGDHPDATLMQLVGLDVYSDEPWHEKAVAALRKRQPSTEEAANEITDEFAFAERKVEQAALDEANREAEALLDGAAPELPPPTTGPVPQRLGTETAWAETQSFANAVRDLNALRAKPIARFVGAFSPAELREIGEFLMAVAAATKTETEAASREAIE
jgi:hypothetical protein